MLTGELRTSRTCITEESETKSAGQADTSRLRLCEGISEYRAAWGSICCCWMSLLKI